jgi:hypothetical protein
MKFFLIAAFAAAGVPALPSISRADEADERRAYYRPVMLAPLGAEEPGYTGPNRALFASGLLAFGGAYAPSMLVASTSSQPADQHLFVPVVGPWLDLASRPGCSAAPGIACGSGGLDRALIITSGIVQGAGVLAVLTSFAFPERDGYLTADNRTRGTAKRAQGPTLGFTPAQVGALGYGLAAFGGF